MKTPMARSTSPLLADSERSKVSLHTRKINQENTVLRGSRTLEKRHKIQTKFGKWLKWRRIHTRYARCADTVMKAIAIAVVVIFCTSSWSQEPDFLIADYVK